MKTIATTTLIGLACHVEAARKVKKQSGLKDEAEVEAQSDAAQTWGWGGGATYSRIACWEDKGHRTLPVNKGMSIHNNSPEVCSQLCKGYTFFGLQWEKECFCGNTFPVQASYKPDSDCNRRCPGNPGVTCGGHWRQDVYSNWATAELAEAEATTEAAQTGGKCTLQGGFVTGPNNACSVGKQQCEACAGTWSGGGGGGDGGAPPQAGTGCTLMGGYVTGPYNACSQSKENCEMCAGTWGGALPPPEAPSGENLVENGGFEEGWREPWLQVGAGSSSMPGWEVTEGGIDFGNYYANGHCKGGACAYEGASFVDMCGSSRGAIAQNVPTKAGYKYQLKFMYDVHATCSGKGKVMRMDVLLDGVRTTRLELANGGTWNLQWNEYSHEFQAAGASSRLELKSVDSACGCMVVDWVQVYEKEPPAQECGSCSNGWSTYPQSSTCAASAANCAQCAGTWSVGPCNAPAPPPQWGAPPPQWGSWAEVEAETDAAQQSGLKDEAEVEAQTDADQTWGWGGGVTYSRIACWEDKGHRTLPVNKGMRIHNNSPAVCSQLCKGYQFFGLQYEKECFCGNTFPFQASYKPDSDCNRRCPGNAGVTCGGTWRQDVYSNWATAELDEAAVTMEAAAELDEAAATMDAAQTVGKCTLQGGFVTGPANACSVGKLQCEMCAGTWSGSSPPAPAPPVLPPPPPPTGANGTCTVWGVVLTAAEHACATSKSTCELCSGTWKPSAPTLLGCRFRPGWARPGGDVPVSAAGAEQCKEICRSRGYSYFGLECPMGSRVHCQCNSHVGGGSARSSHYCQGGGPDPHVHCVGPYVKDGYYFGDSHIGSVYSVN